MIKPEFVDRLVERADLLSLLREYIEIESWRGNLLALCPFHEERSPSFKIYASVSEPDHYHCFGCGAHGNALDFLKDKVGLSFVDAVKLLAQKEGMPVEYLDRDDAALASSGDEKARSVKALSALAKATQTYRSALTSDQAAFAREELAKRGITGETADLFDLGYAPGAWDTLTRDSGLAKQVLLDAGLAAPSQKKPGHIYDFFRDRLMFPIHDRRGNVVAFGARRLTDGERSGPKYLNSPDGIVFHKGAELYGLYQAQQEIQRTGEIIVGEGYFDVVGPAQHGVRNMVGTCGTALTDAQVDTLLLLAKRLIFCFDGDRAGRKATWRAAELLLGRVTDDHEVRLATLPGDHDPDSYVREHGVEAFRTVLADAPTLAEYVAKGLIDVARLNSPEGRTFFVRQAFRYAERISAPILSFFFRKHICEASRITEAEYEGLMAATIKRAARPP